MNLITALLLLTFLAIVGLPKIVDNQFTVKSDTTLVANKVLIADIEKGSPAQKAGLKVEDEITSLRQAGYSPVPVMSAKNLPNITKDFAGKTVDIFYVRDGVESQTKLTLLNKDVVDASQKTASPKGYLGIVPTELVIQRSTWSAPIVAVGVSAQVTALTFQGLGHAVAGLGSLIAGAATGNSAARHNGQTVASSQVSGPVGIFVILKNGSLLGYQYMLLIIAIISLTLAIMNILPIPALDGGRLWLTLITRTIKKPLSQKAEEMINATGFLVLISLIALVTIVDVKRFF